MSILADLSSQRGDRTESANRAVVARCLEQPSLLAEIARGLAQGDARLAGDCAEVFTKTAQARPALIVPYAGALAAALRHTGGRVHWEALHALALVAERVPALIEELLPVLRTIVQSDPSVILRDGAVDALARYASLGPREAQRAYPALCDALQAFAGKQAHHAMPGLAQVAHHLPPYRAEIVASMRPFEQDARAVVRQAARRLRRELEG